MIKKSFLHSKKLWLTLAFITFSVLFMIWFGKFLIRQQISSFLSEQTDFDISTEVIQVSGYPWQFYIQIKDLHISPKAENSWKVYFPNIDISLPPWSFKEYSIRYQSASFYKTKNSPAYQLSCQNCQTKITLSSEGFSHLAQYIKTGLLQYQDHPLLKADSFDFYSDINIQYTPHKVTFDSQAKNMYIAPQFQKFRHYRFPQTISTFKLTGFLSGEIRGQNIQQAVNHWITHQGKIHIDQFSIDSNVTSFDIQSSLQITPSQQLSGNMNIKNIGFDKLMSWLKNQNIANNFHKGTKFFSSFIGQNFDTSFMSKNGIMLNIKNGKVYVGPLLIFRLSPIPLI